MKLEEAIRQREFRSPEHKLMVHLIYTVSHLLNSISEVTQRYGITRQQYNVLRILRGQHPGTASINLIKERMMDKMSDCSRLVDRLEAKQLISRSVCPTDKRAVDIRITTAGLDLLTEMEPSIAAVEKSFGNLSTEDITEFNRLLDQINR
ncbi:MAG: MarR family winged helix-turn-helix transcriptional regulator [Bacteroidota bacterium]